MGARRDEEGEEVVVERGQKISNVRHLAALLMHKTPVQDEICGQLEH